MSFCPLQLVPRVPSLQEISSMITEIYFKFGIFRQARAVQSAGTMPMVNEAEDGNSTSQSHEMTIPNLITSNCVHTVTNYFNAAHVHDVMSQ